MTTVTPVRRSILGPFLSMAGAQLVASGLGFLFWLVAARDMTPAAVGVAAAAISAQTLLGKLCTFGLGNHLIAELADRADWWQRGVLRGALTSVAVAGLVVGSLAAYLLGLLFETLGAAVGGLVPAAVFAVGVASAAVCFVLDQAVLGLGRAPEQVLRNVTASVLRFPLVGAAMVLGHESSLALQVCWVAPLVVSAAVTVLRTGVLRPLGTRRRAGYVSGARAHVRPALAMHALDLSLSAGPLLVPVVAGALLDPVANARFTMAWLLATFVFTPPYMLATALFAASARRGLQEFHQRSRRTLPAAFALSLALCAGTWMCGGLVLRLFGAGYAAESARLLDLLVVAGLWMVLKDHLVARWRVQRDLADATSLAAGGVLLELVGAGLGALMGGATGLCVGWLAALAIEAYGAGLLVQALVRDVWAAGRPPWDRTVRTDEAAATAGEEER